MSAYYDLFEKPDVRQTGEQQSLYARFVPKGTIDRKEFIERVHLFTGLSRSLKTGPNASDSFLVPEDSFLASFAGPSAVSVHDNGAVHGYLGVVVH